MPIDPYALACAGWLMAALGILVLWILRGSRGASVAGLAVGIVSCLLLAGFFGFLTLFGHWAG